MLKAFWRKLRRDGDTDLTKALAAVDGGFLVPPKYSTDVLELRHTVSRTAHNPLGFSNRWLNVDASQLQDVFDGIASRMNRSHSGR